MKRINFLYQWYQWNKWNNNIYKEIYNNNSTYIKRND